MLFEHKISGIKELQGNLRRMAMKLGGAVRAEIALEGASVIAQETRRKITEWDLIESGRLLGSVNEYKVNQWTAGVEVTTEYAATHEYGLYRQPITERQRRFFWAMYAQEGDEKWKALALSSTYTIPPRPYFRVSIREAKQDALDAMARRLWEEIEKFGVS